MQNLNANTDAERIAAGDMTDAEIKAWMDRREVPQRVLDGFQCGHGWAIYIVRELEEDLNEEAEEERDRAKAIVQALEEERDRAKEIVQALEEELVRAKGKVQKLEEE